MRQVRDQTIPCQVFFDFKIYIYILGYVEEFIMDASFHHADKGTVCSTEIPMYGTLRERSGHSRSRGGSGRSPGG
jgi:hypothetical protein